MGNDDERAARVFGVDEARRGMSAILGPVGCRGPPGCRAPVGVGCGAANRAKPGSFDAASAETAVGADFGRIRAAGGSKTVGVTGLMTAADIRDNRRSLFFSTTVRPS